MQAAQQHEAVKSALEWDAEIGNAQIVADAELCIDALPNKPKSNPFAGARDRLRELEEDRARSERRQKGVVLTKALADFATVNDEISQLGADHRRTQGEINALKAEPVIGRWLAAKTFASRFGVAGVWSALGSFLASEAPWEHRPVRIGDTIISQLPETMRFTEEDRDVIRRFVALENHVTQLNWSFTTLAKRQAKLLQDYPALQSLPRPN